MLSALSLYRVFLMSDFAAADMAVALLLTAALGCEFNGSMQHLNCSERDGGVANEVSDADLLHGSR